MKLLKKILTTSALCIAMSNTEVLAAVSPTDSRTVFICNSGSFKIPAPATGETYEFAFSPTTNPSPTTAVTASTSDASGVTIPVSHGTGFYYIAVKNSSGCISDWQEVPVYVLKDLTVSINNLDELCIEQAGSSSATLTGNITNPEEGVSGINLAYQWYLNGTAINDATQVKYTIPTTATQGNQSYELKVGYLIGGHKYCATSASESVNILPRPSTPTINIAGSIDSTW